MSLAILRGHGLVEESRVMDKSFDELPDDCVFEKMSSPIGDLVVAGNDDGDANGSRR